jgi:trk system potassium uptake protein TrkA
MKIAIVGGGKLGLNLTEKLLGGAHSVTLIDKEEALIAKISQILEINTVVGNGKSAELLKELDIASFDYLIATTGSDEKNLVIARMGKLLGVPKVVARIRDPEYGDHLQGLLEMFDIDYLSNPDLSIAEEINKYLVEKYTLTNGLLSEGRISLLEFAVEKRPDIIGTTVQIASRILGVSIFAISDNGKLIIPDDNTIILPDNTVYVVGDREVVAEIGKRVLDKNKFTNIRNVMIAGGGKTGLYLAKMLLEEDISVKIIESSRERCQYLAANLKDALILHGDATDLSLLHQENYDEMEAFVSATGLDEENLLLALMAKDAGVEDVIAKISRESYGDLIAKMGVDMALNPIDISAGQILRYMQGDRIADSMLIQGQAELIEIIVDDTMVILDHPVSNLRIPASMSIIAIQRGEKALIPKANTKIKEGDRVFILVMLTETFDLEKLLIKRKKGLVI